MNILESLNSIFYKVLDQINKMPQTIYIISLCAFWKFNWKQSVSYGERQSGWMKKRSTRRKHNFENELKRDRKKQKNFSLVRRWRMKWWESLEIVMTDALNKLCTVAFLCIYLLCAKCIERVVMKNEFKILTPKPLSVYLDLCNLENLN